MPNMFNTSKKFDDWCTDFRTGRKVSPPVEDRKICDCCGQRIVKGFITGMGTFGDDCREIVIRAQSANSLEKYTELQSKIGWRIKPAIAKFLAQHVFE